MSYPNNQGIVGESSGHSPFNPPVDGVLNGLSLLLTDPEFTNLELIMMGEFDEVDDLRAEILVNSDKFSSYALNRILEDIDRMVDDYRRGTSLM